MLSCRMFPLSPLLGGRSGICQFIWLDLGLISIVDENHGRMIIIINGLDYIAFIGYINIFQMVREH